jgi:hypothetical protein
MDQISGRPIRHRVVVPVDGWTVAHARARAERFGIDPDSREAGVVMALEDPAPEWEAVVTFEVGAAGTIPTGVEIRSTQGQPVTRRVWDRVRLAEVIREAEALAEWLAPLKRGGQPLPASSRPRSPGRPREYDDDHYRRVGAVYMAAKAAGEAPVRAVARAFAEQFPGLTGQTDRRARSWVRAAKRLGFIAEPGKGEQS